MNTENKLTQSISELYEKDIQFVIDHINDDNHEFWRRELIRLVVTLFEAETYLLKKDLLNYCTKFNISLNPQITLTLQGKKFTIENSGKLKEGYLPVKLTDDIKFLFKQINEIRNFNLKVDYQDNGWSDLQGTIKVRNRLTHPKSISEQLVTVLEIEKCMSGYKWFYKNFNGFLQQENEFLAKLISSTEIKIQALSTQTLSNTDSN